MVKRWVFTKYIDNKFVIHFGDLGYNNVTKIAFVSKDNGCFLDSPRARKPLKMEGKKRMIC